MSQENPLQRPAPPLARRHSVSSLSSLSNDGGSGTGSGIQPPGPSHSHLAPRIGSIQDNYDSSSAGGVSDNSVYSSAISSSRQPLLESNTSLENTQLDGKILKVLLCCDISTKYYFFFLLQKKYN